VRAFRDEHWYSTLCCPDWLLATRDKSRQRDGKQMSEGCNDATAVSWQTHSLFAKLRARVILYLDKKHPDCKPTVSWWISLRALSCATDEINTLFIYLQDESRLVSQQREAFDQFIARLRDDSCFEVHFRPQLG
jgi:hypothetical protein